MVVKHVVDQGETPKTITTTVALRCDLRHTARAVNLSTATVGPVSSHFRVRPHVCKDKWKRRAVDAALHGKGESSWCGKQPLQSGKNLEKSLVKHRPLLQRAPSPLTMLPKFIRTSIPKDPSPSAIKNEVCPSMRLLPLMIGEVAHHRVRRNFAPCLHRRNL